MLGLEGYGLAAGCHADFVLLHARNPVEAIRLRATRLAVYRRGKKVAISPAPLSALALPGLSSFVSEILVIVGSYQRYAVAAVIATLGIILASLYVLLTYQRMFTGPPRESFAPWKDLNAREAWVVAPIIAVLIIGTVARFIITAFIRLFVDGIVGRSEFEVG